MFCRPTKSCLLHFITTSIQVTEGRMLISPGPDDGVVRLHVVVLNEGAHKFSENLQAT
jgi:hypothetical protein